MRPIRPISSSRSLQHARASSGWREPHDPRSCARRSIVGGIDAMDLIAGIGLEGEAGMGGGRLPPLEPHEVRLTSTTTAAR